MGEFGNMIRRTAAQCGDLNPNKIHADGSLKIDKEMGILTQSGDGNMCKPYPNNKNPSTGEFIKSSKKEKLPEVEANIKCMQATVEWKYFDNRIELSSTIDTLIEEGYTIDVVIPKTSYIKAGGTTILLTEAIIIVSK